MVVCKELTRIRVVKFPFLKSIISFFRGHVKSKKQIINVQSEEEAMKIYEFLKEMERRGEITINDFQLFDTEEMMKLGKREKKKLR